MKIKEAFPNPLEGIFTKLNESFEGQYPWADEYLDMEYITHSGNKTLSPLGRYVLDTPLPDGFGTPIEQLCTIIHKKFNNKWTRIYKALVDTEYDALNNIDYTEQKTGDNTDTTTFDTNVEDTGEIGTHEVTTRNEETSDDVYGFNSTSPVGDSYSNDNISETIIGDKDKNTNHNVQAKTGTESKVFGIDETITKSGRWYGNPAEYIDKEIDMRLRHNFIEIVFKDVDSLLACPLYG